MFWIWALNFKGRCGGQRLLWLISVRPRPGNNPNLPSHKDTKLRSFRAVRKDLLAVITVINVWCFSRVTDAGGGGDFSAAALQRREGAINLMDQPSYTLSSCVCSVKGVKRDKNQCVRGETKVGPLRSIMINLHGALLCQNVVFQSYYQ